MKTKMPKFRTGNNIWIRVNGQDAELFTVIDSISYQYVFEHVGEGYSYQIEGLHDIDEDDTILIGSNIPFQEEANQAIAWLEYGIQLKDRKEKAKCMSNALGFIENDTFRWTDELSSECGIFDLLFDQLFDQLT